MGGFINYKVSRHTNNVTRNAPIRASSTIFKKAPKTQTHLLYISYNEISMHFNSTNINFLTKVCVLVIFFTQ